MEILGREIAVSDVYVNPFNGVVHLKNLKIKENKSDTLFVSIGSVDANISIMKLFKRNFEISEITIDKFQSNIIQNGRILNFSDLIERFSSDDSIKEVKESFKFSMLNIHIKNSYFAYFEDIIPIKYAIKDVDIKSDGLTWDSDTINLLFSFKPQNGSGNLKGKISINMKTNDYDMEFQTRALDLSILEQYMLDFTNYGSFSANLDTDIKAKGNFLSNQNVTISGFIGLNDFHFGKSPNVDYASFKKLSINIDELSPYKPRYQFDSITLDEPYFQYEIYDYLNNYETMFGVEGTNLTSEGGINQKFNLIVEIAQYVKVLAKNFFRSDYNLNYLGIYDGKIEFNDYSISDKFSVSLNPLTLEVDSVDKKRARINVDVYSGIQPYGKSNVSLSINPNDSSDFDLNYHFENIPLSAFNPYSITYTSYNIDRGTVEVKGLWKVRNGNIQSNNHVLFIDPRVGYKLRNKNNTKIPLPLIMSIVREKGNVIDYQIPINGNLDNPKFHLRDIIYDIITNILVKPIVIPYKIDVKRIESNVEEALSFRWDMNNSEPDNKQARFMKKLANFMEKNPEAYINVQAQNYTLKEKEYILFYEAKKKFYIKETGISESSLSQNDVSKIQNMSIKNVDFVKYIDANTNNKLLFTMQEKCLLLIGSKTINARFAELNNNRLKIFKSYFQDPSILKRIRFVNSKDVIPYNGFSFYKITYKGDIPEYLAEAYNDMDEINKNSPRMRFNSIRNKIKKSMNSSK